MGLNGNDKDGSGDNLLDYVLTKDPLRLLDHEIEVKRETRDFTKEPLCE